MDCPCCGSADTVCLSRVSALYRCRDCGDHFEDDAPTTRKPPRTKMRREED